MTKITFYGAVKEIGGNKILIQDKKTQIDAGDVGFIDGAYYFIQ